MNELTARNTAALDQGLELIDALLGSSSAKGALRVAPSTLRHLERETEPVHTECAR